MSNNRPPNNSRPPERRPGSGRSSDQFPTTNRRPPPRSEEGRSASRPGSPPPRNGPRDPYERDIYERTASFGRSPYERPSYDRKPPYDRATGTRLPGDSTFDAIDRASFERHFGPQNSPSGQRHSSRDRDRDRDRETSYRSSERRGDERRSDEYRNESRRNPPPSQRRNHSSVKRKKQRMSPLIPMAAGALLILVLLIVFAVRACSSRGDEANYTLEFSPNSTLVVGGTATVKIVGLPDDFDGKITWSSTNQDAVSVNAGVLQAKAAADEVTISARVNEQNVSGKIKIMAKVEGVKSLTLTPKLSILSGTTYQMEFKAEYEDPNPPVVTPQWRSSSNAIATIGVDGLITARSVGTTTITAILGEQTAECVVTVLDNPDSQPAGSDEGTEPEPEPDATQPNTQTPATTPQTPTANDTKTNNTTAAKPDTTGGTGTTGTTGGGTNTGTANTGTSNTGTANTGGTKPPSSTTVQVLTISQDVGFLAVGETLTLEAGVSPTSATLTWKSSSDAIASVSSNGVVTAKSAGIATITVTAGSISQTCSIEVTVDTPVDDGGDTPATGDDGGAADAAP